MEIKNGVVTKIYPTDCAYEQAIVEDRTMIIGSGAAANLDVKEVFLPESIMDIQGYAFLNCAMLESINLPVGLKTIGERSFAGCKSLKRIVLPEGLVSIGASAFMGCESLEEIVFPSTIREIKYRTLADCKNLKSVIIPDSVQSMAWGVFSGCSRLEKVTIPDSVTNFEYQMFLNCSNLNQVSLPSSLTSLPDETFMGCRNLEDFILPEAITEVGNYAFAECRKLRAFPEQVETFGTAAFRNCRALSSANINKKVHHLPNSMFDGCIKLTRVTCDEVIPIGERAFKSCISLETIPSFVSSYNKFAFEKCISLKEVKVVNSSIPEGTFRGCKNLKIVVGSRDVSQLGPGAFSGCENLESFECSGNLSYLPASTFEGCKTLTLLALSDGITRIGKRAFYGCKNLPELNLPLCLETIDNEALKGCDAIETICIPDNLKNIGDQAFSYMKSLKRIDVSPRNKTYCTYDNQSLIHKLHQKVIQYAIGSDNKQYSISDFSYYIDELQREVVNPINGIGPYAFAGSSNLEGLILTSASDYIEKSAFDDCNNLKNLYVKRIPAYSEHGFRVTDNKHKNFEIGDFPFENVYLDDTIIGIHISSYSGFKRLKNIHLPNEQLISIRQQAFTRCNDLKEVFIPSCVSSIEPCTFANSTILKFENGIEVAGSDFHDLQKRNDSKVYTLDNGVYHVEKNDTLITITKKEIKELCSHPESIIDNPEILLDYIKLMETYGKKDKSLMNGTLISALNTSEAELLIKDYDTYSETIINASRVISSPYSPVSQSILRNPKKLLDYIVLIKSYQVKDRSLMDGVLIAALDIDEAEMFIKNYDANVKRLVQESKILLDSNTAIENMKDLLKLIKVLGVFEGDPIIKQRACTFITEKIFAEDLMPTKKNDYQIVGDDIHRKFNNLIPRDKFDYEFARFFFTNYKEICEYEKKREGFMERAYNGFVEISRTSTSDKGEQRHLQVTVEKCYNYLLTHKFTGITPETEELAIKLGAWFDDDSAFHNAIIILNEAQSAPRNIFSKFIIDKDKKQVFNNDPDDDLVEPINDNYSFEWLKKQSTDNLLLGKFCSCCAHVNGSGAGIMRASMVSTDCQNLVIRNEINEIIAKSTLYVNRKEGYAVFNNIESNFLYKEDEQKEKIYKAFIRGAKAFYKKYNANNPKNQLNTITIGTSRNTIKQLLEENSDIHPPTPILQAINYSDYSLNNYGSWSGDSSTQQRLVLKKTLSK